MHHKHTPNATVFFIALGVFALLLASCAPIAAPPVAESVASTNTVAETPSHNLTDGCIDAFDPTVDYFPEKLTIDYSEGWTIEYFNHYKVITVLNPWRNAEETFQYVLVQCGAPAPEGYDNAQIIETPINSIITMSTTQLPHLLKLERLDALIGHDDFAYVNTPEVRALIDAGKLIEVGGGADVNVELVLDANPDLVMTYGLGNPTVGCASKLLEAGLSKVALNSEKYMKPALWGAWNGSVYGCSSTKRPKPPF